MSRSKVKKYISLILAFMICLGSFGIAAPGPGNVAFAADSTKATSTKVTSTKTITPPKTKLTRLSSSKKAIIVRWKKVTTKVSGHRITGYQIQLATNKTFTKNKKTLRVKGYKTTQKKVKNLLDQRIYYVRIRTYVVINGHRYNSKWSKYQKIKTDRVRCTESCASLISKYTITYPDAKYRERSTPYLAYSYKTRYKYGDDGYYHLKEPTAKNSCKLIFTGDLMCRLYQQETALEKHGKYKFNESFYFVKNRFRNADLVVGNLETVLCARSPYMSEKRYVDDRPNVNAPATYLAALRYAGFDALVMANNHDCDCGVYGILDTLDNVIDYNFIHTGTFARPTVRRYKLIEINGIKIALMSFATHFNGKDKMLTQEGRDVLLNKYSEESVKKLVKQARSNGAEFIIAYNHWGDEYTREVNSKQESYAQQMADAGVDYIIGSHTHCLQPYDVLTASDGREVPVVYSMGNFLSDMTETITKDNIYLKVQLKRNDEGQVVIADEKYVPCHIYKEFKGRSYAVVPLVSGNADSAKETFFKDHRKKIRSVMGEKIDICKY